MSKGKKTAEAELSGKRLKAARLASDMTLEEAALRAHMLPSTLGNYEQGTRMCPLHAAQRLGNVYREPAAWLVGAVDQADRELLKSPPEVRASFLQFVKQLTR